MKIIEITEKKADMLSEHIEDALLAMGKAMHCIEEMREGAYNERRSGYREAEDMYGERRGNMRYREYEDDTMAERRLYRR